MDPNDIRHFEQARPRLLGLAYRILGSRADAEDAVQDTFLKWSTAERAEIDNPAAWLTTVCTRRCLDVQGAADRKRVDYVGAWLPEPIQIATDGGVEDALMLASSLSTAFLLMLERLTPKERAAYLLHEIFDMPYPDIAEALGLGEANCRQLTSRAKAHIDAARVRHVTPADHQDRLLSAFEQAIATGAPDGLTALLSDDIRLVADSGGKVKAIHRALHGIDEVVTFLTQGLHRYWPGFEWVRTDINGNRGLLVRSDGETHAAASFSYDADGRLNGIYIMRNPDKLARLEPVVVH
jgi:RNA polymerase sigma-70 factor, ECF subfamily